MAFLFIIIKRKATQLYIISDTLVIVIGWHAGDFDFDRVSNLKIFVCDSPNISILSFLFISLF